MKKIFTVAISQDGEWYVAKCIENSVASQGKTLDESVSNLKEALELYYESETVPAFGQTFVTTLEVAV